MAIHLVIDESVSPLALDPDRQAAWLEFSAAMGDIACTISGLDALVVTVAPGAGHGSPACFLRNHAAIEIDGVHLGEVDPATAFPEDPSDRGRFLPVMGLLAHECAHARHSVWSTPPELAGTPAEEAALLLEESRIERAHIKRRLDDLLWLRASATNLVLADMHGQTLASSAAAGRAGALLLARADAGILNPFETDAVSAEVRSIVGLSSYRKLRDIWRIAFTVADDDGETMLQLGVVWCEILGLNPHEAPTPAPGPGAPCEASTATPSEATESSELSKAIVDALNAVAQSVEGEPAPTSAAARAKAAQKAEKDAQTQAAQAAVKVFSLEPKVRKRITAITGRRPATEAERTAARQFARTLNTAGSRERAVIRKASSLPPGRLRMRGALAADAQRAAGQIPTAEPFSRTIRQHTPTPPLRLGIACDASGSMRPVVGAVASAAWILAKAAAYTTFPTHTATVIFGSLVRPITKPGEVPAQVTLWKAAGDREDLPTAIDALDAGLGLSHPGAVRLLVVISDGGFFGAARTDAQTRVNRLLSHGCAALWLAPKTTTNFPLDHVVVHELDDPATTMQVIGKAATSALRRASR